MTLQTVLEFKSAEKAAKDAFFARHCNGANPDAAYFELQAASIAATKARQAAMTAYAASL